MEFLNEFIDAEDIPRILSLRVSKTGRRDGYSWKHTKSGNYTVKSGYAVAVEQRKKKQGGGVMLSEPSSNGLKKDLWKLKAPRKIKHFMWQALSGYVAAASKLKERHCGNDSVCQRCGADEETINHIIFECPSAVQCWALSAVLTSPGVFPSNSIYVNFDTLLRLQKDTTYAENTAFFPWLIWYLWKARNDKCFNNKDTTPMDTLQLAGAEVTAWKIAQIMPDIILDGEAVAEKRDDVDNIGTRGRWRCQVDASWAHDDTGVGLGFILFDENTEIMRGQWKQINAVSPLHAEAESLVWAMEELSGRGFKQVCFESDCQELVQIITNSKHWPALDPELDAIEALRVSFISFSLRFISCSLNIRADSLAKEARARELNYLCVASLVPTPLAPEASTIGPF